MILGKWFVIGCIFLCVNGNNNNNSVFLFSCGRDEVLSLVSGSVSICLLLIDNIFVGWII